jgi:hypothetical protein
MQGVCCVLMDWPVTCCISIVYWLYSYNKMELYRTYESPDFTAYADLTDTSKYTQHCIKLNY